MFISEEQEKLFLARLGDISQFSVCEIRQEQQRWKLSHHLAGLTDCRTQDSQLSGLRNHNFPDPKVYPQPMSLANIIKTRPGIEAKVVGN